jgi:hypothetical protein
MLTFHGSRALSVPRAFALRQALRSNPIRQSEQRRDRDAGSLFLRQLRAIERIEHPARHRDLLAVLEPNDVDLFPEAA